MPRKKQNRIDIPIPLKMVQEFKQKFPDVWEYCDCSLNLPFDKINLDWNKNRCILPTYMCQPIMQVMYEKYNVTPDLTDIAILSGLYSWRKYKEIYSFDSNFAELLMQSADDEFTVPISTLLSTPYSSFYVQIDGENSLGVKGFFCSYDYILWDKDVSNGTGRQLTLNFLAVYEDKYLGCPLVIREGLNIKEAMKWMNMLMSESTGEIIYDPELIQFTHDFITKALQLVLYICAANADISENPQQKQITRKPTVGNQPKDTLREVRKWDVGYRIGSSIRKSTNEAQIPERSMKKHHTLSPKRPHVRKGHFHHYWVGSKSDNSRVLVLKWVAPMFINTALDEELPAVVTKIKS